MFSVNPSALIAALQLSDIEFLVFFLKYIEIQVFAATHTLLLLEMFFCWQSIFSDAHVTSQ